MPIRPKGSLLYFPSLGINLVVDSCSYTLETEPFDRIEFSNDKLRAAKTDTGAKAIFVEVYGGQQIQFTTTCVGNTPVTPYPDDANIDNIKKRWDIKRYNIIGSTSLDSYVNILSYTAATHKGLLAKFQAHLATASGLDISVTELEDMQLESFSYLYSTGFSMYGDPITPAGLVNGAGSLAGASTIPVDFASSIVSGQSYILNRGGIHQEVVVVNTVGGSSFTTVSPTTQNHPANEAVQLYETNCLITNFTPEVDRVIPTAYHFTVRKVWQLTIEQRVLRNARA